MEPMTVTALIAIIKELIPFLNLLIPGLFLVFKNYLDKRLTELKEDILKSDTERSKITNDKLDLFEKRITKLEINEENRNDTIEEIKNNLTKLFDKLDEFIKDFYKSNKQD